jgi:MFS family permease
MGIHRSCLSSLCVISTLFPLICLLTLVSDNAFLPFIQATRGADFGDSSTNIIYRNSLIIAVLGVPGAAIGGFLVEVRWLGRKGTLAASTVATGAFLYATTTALTSNALLGWNCAFSFFSNIMYAVLYAYTPEIFPTKDRGTGNALAASANRVFGIMAVSLRSRFLRQYSTLTFQLFSQLWRCSQICKLLLRYTQVVHYLSPLDSLC